MNKPKLLSTLGLAERASLLVSGEESVLEAVRNRKAFLVFLASDAGPATEKRITDKCSFYGTALLREIAGEELSHAIGKPGRRVVAVTDRKMAELLTRTANE